MLVQGINFYQISPQEHQLKIITIIVLHFLSYTAYLAEVIERLTGKSRTSLHYAIVHLFCCIIIIIIIWNGEKWKVDEKRVDENYFHRQETIIIISFILYLNNAGLLVKKEFRVQY